jgi:hypothetical protein
MTLQSIVLRIFVPSFSKVDIFYEIDKLFQSYGKKQEYKKAYVWEEKCNH